MKYLKATTNSIVLLIIVFSVLLLINCSSTSDDPDLTPEQKQIDLLARTWVLESVMYASDDVTDRFDGFTLTFTSSKTYRSSAERGGFDFEPFKSVGSWDFMDGNLDLIERNDGVEMDIIVTSNSLKMSFLINETNGRLAGLGEYQFEMQPQTKN